MAMMISEIRMRVMLERRDENGDRVCQCKVAVRMTGPCRRNFKFKQQINQVRCSPFKGPLNSADSLCIYFMITKPTEQEAAAAEAGAEAGVETPVAKEAATRSVLTLKANPRRDDHNHREGRSEATLRGMNRSLGEMQGPPSYNCADKWRNPRGADEAS